MSFFLVLGTLFPGPAAGLENFDGFKCLKQHWQTLGVGFSLFKAVLSAIMKTIMHRERKLLLQEKPDQIPMNQQHQVGV